VPNDIIGKENSVLMHLSVSNTPGSFFCPMKVFVGQKCQRPNPKSLAGGESRLWHRIKVDSGIGFSMVNVLESTLEWT
jgi:hypothetical protein